MKNIKACLSLLLAFALLFTSVPIYAFAEEASDTQETTETTASAAQQDEATNDDIQTASFSQTNPIYEDVLSPETIQEQRKSASHSSTPYSVSPYAISEDETESIKTFSDDLEAADHIRQELEKRSDTISLIYVTTEHYTTTSEYKALFDYLFNLGLEETGVPTEGDYIRFQWGHWDGKVSTSSDNGNYYYQMTYEMIYYTTYEQEQIVSEEVQNVLNQLELDGKTTFEKVEAIYHYLVTTVTYDYDTLEDDSYLLKYTAYAALINKTAICQGYAVALYRLLMEADLPARVIRGVSGNENHAWNIVKLGDYWYNADSTWDSSSYPEDGAYSWFLLSQDSFRNHTRDDMYQTSEFLAAYPMSPDDYVIDISDKDAVLEEDTFIYDGTEKKPAVTISGLTEGTDFSVTYSNNIHAGTATATVTGINGRTGSITLEFTIKQAQNTWTSELTCGDVVYGSKPTPSASACFGEPTYTYSSSEDGTYTDDVPTDEGVWYVKATVTETSDYTGLASTVSFSIIKTDADISNENAVLSEDTFTYDGTEKTPSVTISGLTEGTDFSVTYSNNIHAGTATATVTGINDYTGSITLEFTIKQAQNTWTSELTCKSITYGSKPKPSASASFGKAVYTYSSSKNGTYTDTVPTAVGTWYVKATVAKTTDYTGLTATVSFKIKAKDMTGVSAKGFTGYYDGKSHSIKVTAPSGTKITYSTSKNGSYSSKNPSYKKAGTYKVYYKVTKTGYNTVSGSATIKIKLKQPSVTVSNTSSGIKIKWSKVSGATGYRIFKKTSSGWTRIKTITSGSTVTWTHADVTNGSKYIYTVYAYNDNVKSTHISGKTVYRLARPKISSLTNSGSKKMTVKWNRNTKATGYQIQYSTDSSFSSYKTKTVTSNKTLTLTISSLTKGKRYYVRVRSYKTVSNKKYYSSWSAVKNVKISK